MTVRSDFKDKGQKILHVGLKNWQRARITHQAASMVYFALLALVPLLLVVANIIPLLPINLETIYLFLGDLLPQEIFDIVYSQLESYMRSSSGGVISLGVITAIWSASNLINVLRLALNDIYGVKKNKRNPLIGRIISVIVFLAFFIILVILAFLFIFGQDLLGFLENLMDVEFNFLNRILSFRWLWLFVFLGGTYLLAYKIIPDQSMPWLDLLPGTILSALTTLALSELFSWFIGRSSNQALTSAVFGTFIIFMMYVYFLFIGIFLGAFLNVVLYETRYGHTVELEEIEFLDNKGLLTEGDSNEERQ